MVWGSAAWLEQVDVTLEVGSGKLPNAGQG